METLEGNLFLSQNNAGIYIVPGSEHLGIKLFTSGKVLLLNSRSKLTEASRNIALVLTVS